MVLGLFSNVSCKVHIMVLGVFNNVSCKVYISLLDCSIVYHARFIYNSRTIQYCIMQGSYIILGHCIMQGSSYIVLGLFNIVSCKVHISFLDYSILYLARFIYRSWTIQYCILQGSYIVLGLFNIVYESTCTEYDTTKDSTRLRPAGTVELDQNSQSLHIGSHTRHTYTIT